MHKIAILTEYLKVIYLNVIYTLLILHNAIEIFNEW